MAGFFAALSGIPVVKAALTIPFTGIWHADVLLDRAIDLPGPQALTLADTVWTGTIVRAVDFVGQRGMRIVGGTGGWRKTVLPLQYANPAGVPTSMILADLAAQVLEAPPVVGPTIPPVAGQAYVRQGGAASLTLNQLLGDTWWMDSFGIIQATPRLPLLAPPVFSALEAHQPSGVYRFAVEALTGWNPGALFIGPTISGVINRVMHVIDEQALRTEVTVV